MAHVTHADLIAKMGKLATAHHELHRHAHRTAGAPEPPAPAVILPTAGAQPRKEG